MKQSELFPKTKKYFPKDAVFVNHKFLVKGGFIDQLMSGSWTLLPLGFRVVNKINQVIREEMNAIGAQEMLMPLLHPASIWQETGRWQKAAEIMYQMKDKTGRELGLAFTHEEVVMDLLRKNIKSYTDLPVYVYHFSTKFRNEVRARSGILRGREFLMKDLYSAHRTEEELMDYYEKVKGAYVRIFKRLGFSFRLVEASGGVFTSHHTHEFQVVTESGEDTIFYCRSCDWAENREIFKGKDGDLCPACQKGKVIEARAIEVGNIFPLGTWFAEKMGVFYTDKDGQKKPVWFGSYGIGPTRIMGAWVEVSHDEKGIIWNQQMSPFELHLIYLGDEKVKEKADRIYRQLEKIGFEVLYDDRNIPAGEKFNDADLIGIPIRLVVSQETKDRVEWKERKSDKKQLLSLNEVIQKLKD